MTRDKMKNARWKTGGIFSRKEKGGNKGKVLSVNHSRQLINLAINQNKPVSRSIKEGLWVNLFAMIYKWGF